MKSPTILFILTNARDLFPIRQNQCFNEKYNIRVLNFLYNMFLSAKASLKITNNDKLQICRRPGIIAWLLFAFSIFVFVGLSRRLTENLFTLTISIFGGIMFGLDKLGDWEDFVLDKRENRATYTRCNWSEKLCFGKGIEKSTSIKLSEIRHVGVSTDLGLFLLLKNGKTTTLSTNGLAREEIQIMRQEINHFLNLTRIEYLDKLPARTKNHNLRDRLLISSSDSEEEEIIACESAK